MWEMNQSVDLKICGMLLIEEIESYFLSKNYLNVFFFLLIYDILFVYSLDPSPFSRMPFWSVTFGSTMQLVSNIGVSAVCIQRCLSLPTIEKAKK